MSLTSFGNSPLWEGDRASNGSHRAVFQRMNERFLAALRKHHGQRAMAAPSRVVLPQPIAHQLPPLPQSKPTAPLSVGLLDDLDEAELVQIRAILRRESVKRVVEAISEQTGIPAARIVSMSRNKAVVAARHRAFFELQQAGFSLTQMGRMFKKDHTTILHGVRKHIARSVA